MEYCVTVAVVVVVPGHSIVKDRLGAQDVDVRRADDVKSPV